MSKLKFKTFQIEDLARAACRDALILSWDKGGGKTFATFAWPLIKEAKRTFYEWNPSVTLMRTNSEENETMGKTFAQKANAAEGPVAFLLPLKGVSILDGEGELFHDPKADRVMFDAIKDNLNEDITVEEINANINDPEFSAKAVEMMLDLIKQAKA